MQRGGRRDDADARKKAMERLDWLLKWITARQGVAVTLSLQLLSTSMANAQEILFEQSSQALLSLPRSAQPSRGHAMQPHDSGLQATGGYILSWLALLCCRKQKAFE